jgi:Domain of unknown function (DUF4410)
MRRITLLATTLAGAVALAGCAPTEVQSTFQRQGPMPRPSRVLVYDFSVSPEEVQLDRGLSAELVEAAKGTSRSEQEIQVGHRAARALSDELVKRINGMGLPAQRAVGAPMRWGDAIVIEGQFLSIDEGNRTERVVIGLGAGRSDVETLVQVYQAQPTGMVRLKEFSTTAKSGYKPGAAETMGAGAAAGTLAVSAAVTAGGAIASEALGANVEADARRTASDVAEQLQSYFAEQGWIQPE